MRTILLAVALMAVSAAPARAQAQWQDFVITLGGSTEWYTGNLANVSAAPVDSLGGRITDDARALVGELGVRGTVLLFRTRTRTLDLAFDGGLRQAVALGFLRSDYAPREWAGSVSGRYTQGLGSFGSVSLSGRVRGRAVADRPPPPFFMQPGYATAQGAVGLMTRNIDGVVLDAQVDVESSDYRATVAIPQLELLDRRSSGFEAGMRWMGASALRVYGGFRWTSFRNQGSFAVDDPFRRDHTTRVGLEWTYNGSVFAQVGIDGTLNRSNSNRPEYDAITARTLVQVPFPGSVTLTLYALLTAKSYVYDTGFALLVPGEEADNASVAYAQLTRPLFSNLDGAFRLGWTRAETDIGNAYYRRFGASVQLNYRPGWF